MSYDLEDRLQSYGRVLDEAAERHAASLDELEGRTLPTVTPLRTEHRRPLLLAAAVVVALAIAATAAIVATRSGDEQTRVSVVTQPSTTAPTLPPTTATAPPTTNGETTLTTVAPSEATNLASFFQLAHEYDRTLKTLATQLNPHISVSPTQVTTNFSQADQDAATQADPTAVARAIPGGLAPALERDLLVVYNDLTSRWAAMRPDVCVSPGTRTVDARYSGCFRSGAAAAQRFPGDLAAAEVTAARLPPTRSAPASSQAAGDVAVEAAWIKSGNEGCAGTGGYSFDRLDEITWYASPRAAKAGGPSQLAMGYIDNSSTEFYAAFDPSTGWRVQPYVC
jgi:hypothetical protein